MRRLTREEGLKIKDLLESLTKPTRPTCPNKPNLEEYEKTINAIYQILKIERVGEPKPVELKIIDMRDKKFSDLIGGMK